MSKQNPVGIPSAERVWSRIKTEDDRTFYITSRESDRSLYFLYEVIDGRATKIDKDKSPRRLEERNIDDSPNRKGKR